MVQKTDMQLEADRRAAAMSSEERSGNEVPEREVHTYADGSQRVGVPPFPAKSPLEEKQEENRQMSNGMVVPQGMKTSGEAAPQQSGITAEELKQKVETQLNTDVQSGKSPETVNPTTDSNKPELAGTDGHVGDAGAISDNASPEDIAKAAKGIDKPKGATQEQVDAAAAQVAREVKGPIVKDSKAKK